MLHGCGVCVCVCVCWGGGGQPAYPEVEAPGETLQLRLELLLAVLLRPRSSSTRRTRPRPWIPVVCGDTTSAPTPRRACARTHARTHAPPLPGAGSTPSTAAPAAQGPGSRPRALLVVLLCWVSPPPPPPRPPPPPQYHHHHHHHHHRPPPHGAVIATDGRAERHGRRCHCAGATALANDPKGHKAVAGAAGARARAARHAGERRLHLLLRHHHPAPRGFASSVCCPQRPPYSPPVDEPWFPWAGWSCPGAKWWPRGRARVSCCCGGTPYPRSSRGMSGEIRSGRVHRHRL
jgi:hypothetical protein